jgi:hypothetical protein
MSLADAAEILKVLVLVGAPVASVLVAVSAILQTLERARRELAVSLIYNFANQTSWATARAIEIATELPENVIHDIGAKRKASIPSDYYDPIVSILRTAFPEKDLPAPPSTKPRPNDKVKPNDRGEVFQISPEQSAFICFHWLHWLNRLEGTLAAWQQGAASTDLMALEFAPYVEGTSAELEVLSKIRKGLPVIEEFYRQQRDTGRIKARPKLGIFPWGP